MAVQSWHGVKDSKADGRYLPNDNQRDIGQIQHYAVVDTGTEDVEMGNGKYIEGYYGYIYG